VLDYEVKRYQRNAQTMLAPPGAARGCIVGNPPVITDGDTNPRRVRAIVNTSPTVRRRQARPGVRSPRASALPLLAAFRRGLRRSASLLKLLFDRIKSSRRCW
jgi:glutathione S-transferase